MKLCLTILIGVPASGKTTFAQTLKNQFKHYNEKCYNFIHVCYDDLIPVINFEEDETKWKDLRMGILNQTDSLISSIKSNKFDDIPMYFKNQMDNFSPESAVVIIIDDNMYLRSMRYDFFKKAKQHNISFCQVFLKCSIEQAVDRNISRSSEKLVPAYVIMKMSEKIEEPKVENKWEKYSLIINSDNGMLYVKYFNMLNEALEMPESSVQDESLLNKDKSANVCMSVLHQTDIALRQIINKEVQKFRRTKSQSQISVKNLACQLSHKKSQILKNIKYGKINLPENALKEINENKCKKQELQNFVQNLLQL